MRDDPTTPSFASFLLPLASLALAGCTVESDYTLRLSARTLPSQEVFAGEVEIKALLRGVDDAVEIAPADEGIRPLQDDHVGIVVESLGGVQTEFNRFRMLAYGEVGPVSLSTGETEETLDVFVSSFGVVGEMESMTAVHHLAAATMLPRGGVFVVGGGDLDTGTTDDGIYAMENPDRGEWRLSRVADLPGPRAGASANVVEVDGIQRVFIAGGRTSVTDVSTGRPQAHLYDTLEERLGWSGELSEGRSEHASLVLENGKVLLVGGWSETGDALDNATFEIFDPATRTLSAGSGSLDMPAIGLAVASLGPDGALVCGGGALANGRFSPSTACNRISLTGQISAAADMLGPRMGHALLRLDDDSVLLTGGIDVNMNQGELTQSITTASLYIPRSDEWRQIGPMELRRVGHSLVATGDGRYLAIGGSELSAFDGTSATPRDCTEIFDPSTFQWEVLTPCAPAGRGAGAAVASSTQHGAFVLTGYDPAGSSGQTYGWVGFGPPVPAAE